MIGFLRGILAEKGDGYIIVDVNGVGFYVNVPSNTGAYLKAEEMRDFMENTCGLAFDYGDWFGGERFGTHVRMNLATSGELVRDAVSRITQNLIHRS